jgi:ribosome-associated translation inhibitor RaiA
MLILQLAIELYYLTTNSKFMKEIKKRTENLIFKIAVKTSTTGYAKDSFHLDYEKTKYRQSDLVKLIRDTVLFFALTPEELSKINAETTHKFQKRAWKRISDRPKEKKGDYGELLLFLILEVFYPARKLVTKVRLRSSMGDEIKGFDCAHFSIDENDGICLWLGEAKFHQSFSTAINKAVTSLNEHLSGKTLKDEISILEGNNTEIDEATREKIENYLNSGISLDKMNFKIPTLLTFDSNVIKSHKEVCKKFIEDLEIELQSKYLTIDKSSISLSPNVELQFILFPLETIAAIKEELENIEKANK